MTRRNPLRAFTLIELLLVLVILAVLASVAIPIYTNKMRTSRRNATIAEISNLKSALNQFELDNSRFPYTSENLLALVMPPPGLERTWGGPYIEKVPEDKWGHTYNYTSPGVQDPNSFDLVSAGDDGVFATEDDIDKYTDR